MAHKYKAVHFVGIKGVGMTSLALIAKQAGCSVSGSDVKDAFITDDLLRKEGISVFEGFDPAHVGAYDLVITTGAHGGYNNPEVIKANELGIPVLTQGEAVGKMMDGSLFLTKKPFGISVAGSHGKTTTTGMIATLLAFAGLDPSYVIGTSLIPSLDGPGHLGKGKYLVVEADEYATEPHENKKAKLLWQHPDLIVLTNVDFDHPDIYQSLDDVISVFTQFIASLPKNGILVTCGDDEHVKRIISKTDRLVITYGYSPKNDYYISRTHIEEGQMFITVEKDQMKIGDFHLNVSGRHNGLNAVAAIVTCVELGLSPDTVKEGLRKFTGSKRRMEYLGKLPSGAYVYDDYAHHPKEIDQTLQAFKKMFPSKKLTVIFQPHTYSRTQKLFDQFISSFGSADTIGIMDIFGSMREDVGGDISAQSLAQSIKQQKNSVFYLPKSSDVVEYIDQNQPDSQTVLVFMGAGDVYKIAETLSLEK